MYQHELHASTLTFQKNFENAQLIFDMKKTPYFIFYFVYMNKMFNKVFKQQNFWHNTKVAFCYSEIYNNLQGNSKEN